MKGASWVIALAFAGCSFQASCGGKSLNMENAKKFVTKMMTEQAGAPPTTVTCPDSVKLEKGKTFECTATYGASEAKLLIDQDDDQGNVTVKSVTGVVLAKRAEAEIAEQIGKQTNLHVTVDCGERVHPATAGHKLTCKATDANGQSVTVEVEVRDAEGNIRFRTVPTP